MTKTISMRAALAAATVGLAACSGSDLLVTNPNSPSVTGAVSNPQAVQFLATGLAVDVRNLAPTHVRNNGIIGREVLFFQTQDGRWITGFLRDWADPNSFWAGAAHGYSGRYGTRRDVVNFLNVVASVAGLSDADRSAARGYAKTIDALEMFYVATNKGTLGAPVGISDNPEDVFPFVSRDSAYSWVAGRLDEALADLQGGGAAFPFVLPTPGGSGFTGFSTPAAFQHFNRMLKARIEVYRATESGQGAAAYTRALAALNAIPTSVLPAVGAATTTADLQRGVYNVFSSAAGDRLNADASFALATQLYAYPTLATDNDIVGDPRVAQGASGVLRPASSTSLAGSVTSTFRIAKYPNNDSPISIIRVEEAILIRAEANYFTGQTGPALTDINTIRGLYGQAARGAFADADDFRTELLRQRRLSLLLEGHRWLDARRFGRLGDLPAGNPEGTWTPAQFQPTPQQECIIRGRTGDPALRGGGCP